MKVGERTLLGELGRCGMAVMYRASDDLQSRVRGVLGRARRSRRGVGGLCLAWACSVLSAAGEAEAQPGGGDRSFRATARMHRAALVIGNASYAVRPLSNPVNDARKVAKALDDLGFDVVRRRENLDLRSMDRETEEFAELVREKGGLAFVYFSGHGMELEGENYLIPVDLRARKPGEVRYGALRLNLLLARLERDSGANIVILDACRDNPYRSFFKSTGSGLGSTQAPAGTFIAFATAPGQVAEDGLGSLGTFTASFVKHLTRPGLSINDVLLDTRNEVFNATKGEQVPWESSSLRTRVFLAGRAEPEPTPPPVARRDPDPPPTPASRVEPPSSPGAPEGMVAVPAGPFFMGCNEKVDTGCDDDEKPGKTVDVKGFYIDRTEVTVSAYAACVRAGECTKPDEGGGCNWGQSGREQHPINCVDWQQARAFCAWQGKELPTEKEWEKAARGTDGQKYPWGNEPVSCRYAVLYDGDSGCGRGSTWPVGSKPNGASPYGALDMAGNVWEWTADWYTPNEYRAIRGGSWYYDPRNARASYRDRDAPSNRNNNVGFRCLQSF